jgi:hypothetical protein
MTICCFYSSVNIKSKRKVIDGRLQHFEDTWHLFEIAVNNPPY